MKNNANTTIAALDELNTIILQGNLIAEGTLQILRDMMAVSVSETRYNALETLITNLRDCLESASERVDILAAATESPAPEQAPEPPTAL